MYYYGREKRRRFKRRVTRSLAAIATLGVIALSYYLFFDTDRKPDVIYSVNSAKDNALARNYQGSSQGPAPEKTGMQRNNGVDVIQNYSKTGVPESDEKIETLPQKVNIEKAGNVNSVKKPSHETVYEVVSEAHFYSRPHEHARRRDFIPYWNVSSSIKPIKEKNSFVYVQYKPPLGKSKTGWLRKKDLKKVNTNYENNKD